jgi:CRP/FNR family cyclic AMP-dependent transcriptional regulator
MESAIQPNCLECSFRPDRIFCDMPADALQAFNAIKTNSLQQKGTFLFTEGKSPKGIYLLCEGRAKLTICSEQGKRLMLRIAGPGEVLGLGASLSGTAYEVTAELLDTSQVVFVRRKELTNFLRDHQDACMTIVQMLSQDLHGAYERVRSIGLTRTRRPRSARSRAMAS